MQKCRGCGADVPANAPFGHCPKCLLELGFGPVPEGVGTASLSSSTGGRAFGDYELLDQIGRGGMGVIYKARQVSLNRPVALKMVSSGEFASPTMVQRFHLEAEAAANLHHPNIVPIYETGDHHGQHFFSMELIDGAGVDRYITGAGFCFGNGSGADKASLHARQEQIARIMAKVARAVDHAHQHGILHRDLKPGNILLDRKGEPHLTDFGVAKVIGNAGNSLTLSGAVMGTPSYMAPEQAAGQSKRVTTAADIYSLGAVLYAMLTGQPPFRADTPVETLRQVVEQEPKHPTTFNEGIDRDLANICLKCMEKEPQRRYSSAGALADDLERWLRGEPILARPIGTAERAWRWCRRNPKVAALGTTVALLLIALALGATVFALRIENLRDSSENNNRQLRSEVLDNLAKVYEDPSSTYTLVKAEVRHALLGGRSAKPFTGVPLRVVAVEHLYEHPTNVLRILAPVLQKLEDDLSERFNRPVLVDLRLFKTYELVYEALESNSMSFGRVGPSSYSRLLDRGKGIKLLAMQDHKYPLTMAIFALTNSTFARILAIRSNTPPKELFTNVSIALGGSNSTTGSYLARWFLVTNGIFATNFSRYTHTGSLRGCIDQVRSGLFNLGVGNRDVVDDYPELTIIAKLEVSDLGRCWVAGNGLDNPIFQALRDSLLRISDPAILGNLESEVVGFKMLNDDALERLRVIMRGAAAFDPRVKYE